jgi:homoserine kinase type II
LFNYSGQAAFMAVFTPVSDNDAQQLLCDYDLGDLVSLKGIATGIENTNYFLTTTHGEFVLTLFEVLNFEQLPFYIELMHHLAVRNIAVPKPQTRQDGSRISKLHGKPAAIVTKLIGGYEPNPNVKHCRLAATTLAQSHLAAADFPIWQPNLRGLSWWKQTAPKVLPFLNKEQTLLLEQTLQEQVLQAETNVWLELPEGPAHCDLFRDNVLFAGTQDAPIIGGLIDFYFAGCDKWLFDVAVCINDWCINHESGALIQELATAWLEAYAAIRPFTEHERICWPYMLKAAALRFWLSRLYDFYIPRAAQVLKPHDPSHFERILKLRTLAPIVDLPKDF